MALVVVHQLRDEVEQCFRLDTCCFEMAALEVLEEPVLLHIAMHQNSFEKVNFEYWLLAKVVLLEGIDDLALILRVLVKVKYKLIDFVVKSVEHSVVPSLFL